MASSHADTFQNRRRTTTFGGSHVCLSHPRTSPAAGRKSCRVDERLEQVDAGPGATRRFRRPLCADAAKGGVGRGPPSSGVGRVAADGEPREQAQPVALDLTVEQVAGSVEPPAFVVARRDAVLGAQFTEGHGHRAERSPARRSQRPHGQIDHRRIGEQDEDQLYAGACHKRWKSSCAIHSACEAAGHLNVGRSEMQVHVAVEIRACEAEPAAGSMFAALRCSTTSRTWCFVLAGASAATTGRGRPRAERRPEALALVPVRIDRTASPVAERSPVIVTCRPRSSR